MICERLGASRRFRSGTTRGYRELSAASARLLMLEPEKYMIPHSNVLKLPLSWLPFGLLCLFAIPTSAQSPSTPIIEPPQHIAALLRTHCFDCHGDDTKKGDFSLEQFVGSELVRSNTVWDELANWQRMEKVLINGQMPPDDADPIPKSQRSSLTRWVSDAITSAVRSQGPIERMTLRRLNNIEYANTMRDLLGIDTDFTSQLTYTIAR